MGAETPVGAPTTKPARYARSILVGGAIGGAVALLVLALPAGAGTVRWFAVVAPAAAGILAGFAAAARRQAKAQIARVLELKEELRFSQDHIMASETFRSLGPYLEIVAHEVKEPLRALTTGLKTLESDGLLPAPARAALAPVARHAATLEAALRHLTGYALSRPGRSPFNVNTLLHEAILLCRHRAREKGIAFEESYGLVPPVMGSAVRVHQALLNLVVNAVEAMPFGGGTIAVTTAHEGDHVVARVRDTGIGIRPEQLPHIFEPFFTTKPERRGVGLGLWASRNLLDIIGADIEVRSTPLAGTEVTVRFPQAAPLRPGREGTEHPQELPRNTADDRGRQIA